jgi:hypothetical protein
MSNHKKAWYKEKRYKKMQSFIENEKRKEAPAKEKEEAKEAKEEIKEKKLFGLIKKKTR